ncbi:hypothetical protein [Acinetobacter sp. ANC 3813]|uniref:hypothetical protein n=1 Tax=Acinetobacter sp. ANC 3813 TaxID=1977873 RepID=UPI000A349621|nr:hypothetical protein [Acinetobacter sp. ANC 3813]OTG87877.1 hypothetical protein B9T34_16200 [Acinetobacter sp. ANC 3813]
MRIFLSDGTAIGTDRFVSGTCRTDCVPVPASLEFQTILHDSIDEQLREGCILRVGDDYLEMKIIKRVTMQSGIIRDDQQLTLAAVVAVLNGCENLIKPAARAVYLNESSIGAAMRANGNKLKVTEDVPLVNYFCAVGATPTYELARKCSEEACVIFCDKNSKIIVKRLSQIMNQEPVSSLAGVNVQWVENPTQLNHSIPNYQTVNSDGSTIEGSLSAGKQASFYPNIDARRARNLSTVLVVRGTIMRAYTPEWMAGNVVLIDQKKYVILTAAHRFDTGVLGGATASASKFWIAEVVTA